MLKNSCKLESQEARGCRVTSWRNVIAYAQKENHVRVRVLVRVRARVRVQSNIQMIQQT